MLIAEWNWSVCRVFIAGQQHGFDMTMLDIGGGFCGGNFGPGGKVDLGGVPAAVNAALEEHFPATTGTVLPPCTRICCCQGLQQLTNGHMDHSAPMSIGFVILMVYLLAFWRSLLMAEAIN